ncbi:hypothetical protein C364_01130 [Cryptococcus neoformans Bt63]|nr:hypothetical protein C364_01130 [Cryptococcus neoformans var. grubii Bt63]
MPNSKTIHLILPPPIPSRTPPPSLDVLLEAQRIAAKNGQKLDIQSLLSPDQLEEYRVRYLKLPPGPHHGDRDDDPEKRDEREKQQHSIPHVDDSGAGTPGTPISAATVLHAGTSTPVANPGTPPANIGTPTASPATLEARLKYQLPDLSHLHWKRRQKRLAEIAREQEMLANGEIPEVSTIVVEETKPKGERKLTEKEKEAIKKSTSYWNSLLVQARKDRGPQWDFSTQQLLYDRRSDEYYTHGRSPPPTPPSKKRKVSNAEAGPSIPNGSVKNPESETSNAQPTPTINPPSLPSSTPSTNTRPISRGNPQPVNGAQSTPGTTSNVSLPLPSPAQSQAQPSSQTPQPPAPSQTPNLPKPPPPMPVPPGAQDLNPSFLSQLQSLTPAQLSALQSSNSSLSNLPGFPGNLQGNGSGALGQSRDQFMGGTNGLQLRAGGNLNTLGQNQMPMQMQMQLAMQQMGKGNHSAGQGLNSVFGLGGMSSTGVMGPPLGGHQGGQGPMVGGNWRSDSSG